MPGCVAGAILKVLASMIMDLPLRSQVCWELMGFMRPNRARSSSPVSRLDLQGGL